MIQRQTGVALWRQVADQIRMAISENKFENNALLPTEKVLSELYKVNRHTVRAAIKALSEEGVVRSVQGRGTEILQRQLLRFPINTRTRFSENLAKLGHQASVAIVSETSEAATPRIAASLGVEVEAPLVALETVYYADGVAVSHATNWFDAGKFGDIGKYAREMRSITRAFSALGVEDYTRVSTEISASHAQERDRALLNLSAGAIMLETFSINADAKGNPVQAARTRFSADRVSLEVRS